MLEEYTQRTAESQKLQCKSLLHNKKSFKMASEARKKTVKQSNAGCVRKSQVEQTEIEKKKLEMVVSNKWNRK